MNGRIVGRALLAGRVLLAAFVFVAALAGPWATVAFAAQPPAVSEQVTPVRPIPLPADVELRVGQTVTLDGGDLRLWFVGVDEDDRCPHEVACEWPGRAVIRMRVTLDHEDHGEVTAALYAAPQPPPDLQFDAMVSVGRYVISLVDLQPYPVFGQTIAPNQRVATIRVTAS